MSADVGFLRGSARDLAYGSLFAAAGLVLPGLFHVLHLGPYLLPMYWPLACLPFFVRASTSIGVAALVPVISALATGMPPLVPPVAGVMALEIAAINGTTAALLGRFPRLHPRWALGAGLAAGRVIMFASWQLLGRWLGVPAVFASTGAVLAGLPGCVAMLLLLPPVVRLAREHGFAGRTNDADEADPLSRP